MCTTKPKCVMSRFLNLFFMNDKVEKIHSSSTLPKTMAIQTNSTSFSHFKSLREIIWLLANNAHIYEHICGLYGV